MKTWLRTLTLLALLAVPLLPGMASAQTEGGYRYKDVYFPGSANSALYAINVRGQYVGALKESTDGNHHAIHGRNGTTYRLDQNGPIGTAVQSWAFTTNARGEIGGTYIDSAGATHGYIWHPGGRVDTIDMPGAVATQVYGINDLGQFIGLYTDAGGIDHAYVNRDGNFVNADLPNGIATIPLSINDAGQIAGEFIVTDGTTGYGYVQFPDGHFTLSSAPGAPPEQTFFISINNRRQVLGTWFDGDGNPHNFIRKHGRYVPFNLPDSFGAVYVQAETINDQGDIVGVYFDSGFVAHGFLADPLP